MKILLTNDDGIRAAGILALYREMADLGHEVRVVAPSSERSANSHAITWKNPLKVRALQLDGFSGYEVEGTPADCTRMGLLELYPDTDWVLSGINAGANLGADTLYSGTVAAAMEGVLLGKPALAVSLEYSQAFAYGPTAKVAGKVLAHLQEKGMPQGLVCSLNTPNLPYEDMRGIRLAELEPDTLIGGFERFDSQLSGSWYYMKADRGVTAPRDATHDAPLDRTLIRQGFATVTFLQWRLSTDAPFAVEGIRL